MYPFTKWVTLSMWGKNRMNLLTLHNNTSVPRDHRLSKRRQHCGNCSALLCHVMTCNKDVTLDEVWKSTTVKLPVQNPLGVWTIQKSTIVTLAEAAHQLLCG